jgi:predicted DNA-binding transcriptional regulator AlpA
MTRQLDREALAEKLGVRPQTVSAFLSRARKRRAAGVNDPADFPEPTHVYGRSPVWDEDVIDRWMPRRPGPGPRRPLVRN